MHIADFRLNDLKSRTQVYINVMAFPGSMCLSVVVEPGDIEIAFGPEDGEKMIALLEQGLAADHLGVGENLVIGENVVRGVFHQFQNLDGGAKATFVVGACNGGIEITVERSDEGYDSFSLSASDASTLTSTLKSALKVAAAEDARVDGGGGRADDGGGSDGV